MSEITDNRTYITNIADLPEDTVIRIDPDFEAPGIEWRKCDKHRDLPHNEYFSLHNQPEVGGGVTMKSICDLDIKPFETTGLISGQGLTTILDGPLQIGDSVPEDATLTFDHDGTDTTFFFNAQPTVMVSSNDFSITNEDGENLVKIDMKSGDVEYGEQYCLNDAARIFWDAIGTYRQPDAWEENENLTSTQVLVELRNILGVKEGGDIIVAAKQMTNNQMIPMSAPGCLDDMPEEYMMNFGSETSTEGKGSKVETLPGGFESFDNAMKVID